MFRRFMLAIATVAALGISFCPTDSFAAGHHGSGYHGGGHRGGGWRGGGRWGGFGAGFVGGAILGGLLASPYYYGSYDYYAAPGYFPDDAVAYCMQRFRSYDPNSGTYLGYDGRRHRCP
jgi:hypothetical protein